MATAPHRVRGVRILKAVSSPTRLQILNHLFDSGPLSYTELMSALKMNPSRDAGRFAYHLKFLLKADLMEADAELRKYCLTEMGKMVIDVADKIEKRALRPKSLLVRTSRLTLEEFDANKIAHSVVKEARMPPELAQKIAKEAEKRLLKSKTKYLTAPLVREVVNGILVERGLEEYRHKLTRLGVPVHDVTALLEAKSKRPGESASVHERIGEAVFKEYVLLNVFPRDVADAHLSGAMHIKGLASWILKPAEVMHDMRFFFQHGLDGGSSPPQNVESALSLMANMLAYSSREIEGSQTLNYFNVFLAPFVRGVEATRMKELLRLLLFNASEVKGVSLGLELAMPSFVADKPAVGPSGKRVGVYADFCEESLFVASSLLEVLSEENGNQSQPNVKVIVKLRKEVFENEKTMAVLLKAHEVASQKGLVYFANLTEKEQGESAFSSSGYRVDADIDGDWETDTLRTGCLGSVAVNLPRIAYESEKDKAKFLEFFKGRLEMCARALEIKGRALQQHGKELLPFLLQSSNGEGYFRLENCSRLINLVGLREATEVFCGKSVYKDEAAAKFAEELVEAASDFLRKAYRRREKRLLPAMLPCAEASERLVQLDIERLGIGKTRYSGTREKPFYSTVNRLAVQDGKLVDEQAMVDSRLNAVHSGGSLTVVDLGDAEHKPEGLLSMTRQLIGTHKLRFFTYARRVTYCSNCRKSWFGLLHKCPTCGSVGTLTVDSPFATA